MFSFVRPYKGAKTTVKLLSFSTEIRCKPPPPVNNGLQVWSSRTGYGVLRLKCVPGYELVGMNTTRCLHNRSWSPPIGQCIRKLVSTYLVICMLSTLQVYGRITGIPSFYAVHTLQYVREMMKRRKICW